MRILFKFLVDENDSLIPNSLVVCLTSPMEPTELTKLTKLTHLQTLKWQFALKSLTEDFAENSSESLAAKSRLMGVTIEWLIIF